MTNSPTILTFTSVKLVKNKVTFVHRRLWPALVAVGISRADWQLERLSRAALSFLERVEREGPVRSDRVKGVRGGSRKVGELVRDLEKRLLLHSEPVHTESGAHAKSLESWGQWAARVDLGGTMTSAKEGKTVLGTAARALCGRSSAAPRLPWNAEDARWCQMIIERLARFFGVSAAGSSVRTEIIAGVSTYMALSYIILVNPPCSPLRGWMRVR